MFPLVFLGVLALANPYEDLQPHRTYTVLDNVTPELHWFDADFLDVEWAGCLVGVPVVPAEDLDEATTLISCWFPAGRGASAPPEDRALLPHYRHARRVIKKHNDPRRLSVRYVGTWREVTVTDFVPTGPVGPRGERRYDSGTVVYSLDDGVLAPLRASGGTGLLCFRPEECPDAPVWVAAPAPPDLEGTSILKGASFYERDARYVEAERAVREAVVDAVAAWDSGAATRPPEVVTPERVHAPGVQRALLWEVAAYARPKFGDDGSYVRPQESEQRVLEVPLHVAVDQRVGWTIHREDLGLTVEMALDLPASRAFVTVTGPAGDVARSTWRVELDITDEDGTLFLDDVLSFEEILREPDIPTSSGHEGLLTVPGRGDFASIDVYPRSVRQSERAWSGSTTWEQ
ncbi:MAG: hypothetical protein JRI25_11635 [Deltaproteobacteria bacterium]|nr:hypothetical protein [Deltaproteobacteria bacterium]MBW2255237.1 hypothetical protein [Deltaproteobacteria bacterium]